VPIPNATHHPRPPFPPPPPLPYPPEPPRRPEPPPSRPLPPWVGGPVVYTAAPAAAGPDPVLDKLLEERIIFLGREIDDEIANRISAQLLLLDAQDPERDITIYINSPGGSVTAGMAIYNTMRLIRPDVATWAVGLAASMGQFLLSAGAPGKRYALAHARILMRQPSAGGAGRATDIAIRAGVFSEMKREIAEITARHTGQTVETIIADSDRDRWFTATEAQAYGLVDHVVTD
jgi:ATP-dependent Clp protease, protease subunit